MRYEKRLRVLAQHAGLCPVHMTRPVCLDYDMVWTGTDAEQDELFALIGPWDRGGASAPVLPCRCGAEAICLDCFEVFMARHPLTFRGRLSPEARARYDVLIRHQQVRLACKGTRDAL
jgi:hypothetical protein